MDNLLKYWPILLVILNVLGVWVMWSIGRGLVTKREFEEHARANAHERKKEIEVINKRISDVDAKIAGHEREQTRLTTLIEGLPTQQQITSLSSKIAEVGAGVEGLGHQMSLLLEHHLDLAKPKGS